MIACVCRAVSDRAIRAAAAAGATAEDIARATGAGSACGCCADFVRLVIEEEASCHSSGAPCQGCPRRSASAG